MVDVIVELSLVLLVLAALVFVVQVLRQKTAGHLSATSFSTLLLLVLIGWMVTEVAGDAAGQTLGQLGRVTHFAVMILFALTITLQLRRSTGK